MREEKPFSSPFSLTDPMERRRFRRGLLAFDDVWATKQFDEV
jgi:hypothetical protein